ncbi:MAG: protein translocase subunit SecF [Candidatus Omnitrophica bacterium]|nr:protein translocase subunit SecF [Candidatus Omnitrophota bacterium]
MKLIKKETRIDFFGKRRFFFFLSALFIVLGLFVFIERGRSNFAIDFTGGRLLQLRFEKPISLNEIRNSLKNMGLSQIPIQEIGKTKREIVLKTTSSTSGILAQFRKGLDNNRFEIVADEMISPTMGKTLRRKGLLAFFYGIIGILCYVAFRFEFRFAACGVIAIFHDILITIGFLALFGKQIDGKIIAALLALAGYSINDTIVIFDRIRENLRKTKKTNHVELFNESINQVLGRTLITSFTTILVLLSLFFLGGDVIHNFAFALLVGVITGTYSSIFIASALVIEWEKKSPHRFRV